MNNNELIFRTRKKIFEEWVWKGSNWKDIKDKYGFSKSWFYKYRQRYIKHGNRGLENKPQDTSFRPHRLSWQQKLEILDCIYNNPAYGPDRISRNLNNKISAKAVWSYLETEGLNTRRKRLFWAHSQGKPVLTDKQIRHMYAKHNHIESTMPGELVCMDTFWVNIKNLGQIWQWTACDSYSSFGWAKVYPNKYCDNTVDFMENHIVKNSPVGKIKRILTDRGCEFCYPATGTSNAQVERACQRCNIIHSVTKPAHPWTNGYAERLNQTIWQEFYLSRLSKPFNSLQELQKELDEFMRDYNFKRMHTGYKLKEAGFRYPAEAFFDLQENKKIVEMAY
jgi:transposase InsO family protein